MASWGTRISLRALRRDVDRRVGVFVRGRRRVAASPDVVGGAAVFAGTRIPVRHIGLLARKVAVEEILADYPALDHADVEFARYFAELGPGPGPPRKALADRRAIDPARGARSTIAAAGAAPPRVSRPIPTSRHRRRPRACSRPVPSGVVYPSVRSTGGTCLACFRPGAGEQPTQDVRYRFRWTGEGRAEGGGGGAVSMSVA